MKIEKSPQPDPTHIEVRLIQLLDGLVSSIRIGHGHKGKTTRAATLTVLGDESILQAQNERCHRGT